MSLISEVPDPPHTIRTSHESLVTRPRADGRPYRRHSPLRVVAFIATLGMLGIARGIAKFVANEQTVNPPATWLNELAVTFPSHDWMLFAPGVWIAILLAALMALVLRNTVFGRHVFAIG